MGRSGTSLTAELVRAFGVDLGPVERMLPPVADDNAHGYWEQEEIYLLNEDLLGVFGGSWESPPALPQGWVDSPAVEPLLERAQRLVGELFGPSARWGFKDPRAALTAPFWERVVGLMDYVICVRHPLDVAASVLRRGSHQLDRFTAVDMWVRYTRAALRVSARRRRLVVFYEDYFAGDASLEQLARFVSGGLLGEAVCGARSHIDADLWHNRAPRDDMSLDVIRPDAQRLLDELAAIRQPAVATL